MQSTEARCDIECSNKPLQGGGSYPGVYGEKKDTKVGYGGKKDGYYPGSCDGKKRGYGGEKGGNFGQTGGTGGREGDVACNQAAFAQSSISSAAYLSVSKLIITLIVLVFE
jgi:hypothetical protein